MMTSECYIQQRHSLAQENVHKLAAIFESSAQVASGCEHLGEGDGDVKHLNGQAPGEKPLLSHILRFRFLAWRYSLDVGDQFGHNNLIVDCECQSGDHMIDKLLCF